MSKTVFYSWQSDVRGAACRTLIQDALEASAKAIAASGDLDVEPTIDRDIQGVPGAPDIGATIFAKIDAAAAFVADVTIVGETAGGRPTPNPNVLIELGYALRALGGPRVVLVQNTAFGGPELLPFDLRQKVVMTYASPADAPERAPERRVLEAKLTGALHTILKAQPRATPDVTLTMDYYADQTTQNHHHYILQVEVQNTSRRRLQNWELEIQFPAAMMDGVVYGIRDERRSTSETAVFLVEGRRLEPLRPGEEREVKLGYIVNDTIYARRDELFAKRARARVLVDGKIVAEVERSIDELQNF
jgi:hypothetical protein